MDFDPKKERNIIKVSRRNIGVNEEAENELGFLCFADLAREFNSGGFEERKAVLEHVLEFSKVVDHQGLVLEWVRLVELMKIEEIGLFLLSSLVLREIYRSENTPVLGGIYEFLQKISGFASCWKVSLQIICNLTQSYGFSIQAFEDAKIGDFLLGIIESTMHEHIGIALKSIENMYLIQKCQFVIPLKPLISIIIENSTEINVVSSLSIINCIFDTIEVFDELIDSFPMIALLYDMIVSKGKIIIGSLTLKLVYVFPINNEYFIISLDIFEKLLLFEISNQKDLIINAINYIKSLNLGLSEKIDLVESIL